MNWLQRILEDCQLTRYRLSQESGVSERYLGKIVHRDIPMENVKYGQVMAILEVAQRYREIQARTSNLEKGKGV